MAAKPPFFDSQQPNWPLARCPNCEVEFIVDIPAAGAILCPNPKCEREGFALVHEPRSEAMTADDARKMTAKATTCDNATVEMLLRFWYLAIKKAAEEGRTSIREHEVDRTRQLVPSVAHKITFDHMKEAGFVVRTVQTGPNEWVTEVSWEQPPIPPRGGSGTPPRLRT